MITMADLTRLQETVKELTAGRDFAGRAIGRLLQSRVFSPEERLWFRDAVFSFVQLKNRYRAAVEMFFEAEGRACDEDDLDDVKLWLALRHGEGTVRGGIEEEVWSQLQEKAKIRKLAGFLRGRPLEDLFRPKKKKDVEYLWRFHSHPLWVVRKWIGLWDYEQVVEMCRYNNSAPDTVIRVNPLRTSAEDLAAELRQQGVAASLSPASPFGVVTNRRFDPMTQPGYRDGVFTLQSLSSQLVCFYVNPKPGSRVLDYCAGEGSKTLTLAHIMKGKGEIQAHDKQMWRLQSLQKRLRKENVQNVRMEGLSAIKRRGTLFDTVLVDAPCTGSGNFQRQPELKWRLRDTEPEEMNKLQLGILDEAAPFCAPGGMLFYVTCSLFQEENHKVVRRFLSTHEGWELVAPETFLAARHAKGFWIGAEAIRPYVDDRYFQVLPYPHHMPGMFCAVLRRS